MRTAIRLVGPAMLLVLLLAALSVASAQTPGDSSDARTPTSVSLTPAESWSCIRDHQTLTASVADGGGGVAGSGVEFILNRFPQAVGDIVAVSGANPSKVDNTYATADANANGQATATLTATRPGDTDVTAFAPAVTNDDAHKSFGVVHWVDGCPRFPGDAENPTGMPHPIVVGVYNVSDGSAVEGVPVRFYITDDQPNAQFADASGDGNMIEGVTDASGVVNVTLTQAAPSLGDNSVYIEVLTDDGRTMFDHTMVKVWKSPVLSVSASGPGAVGLLRDVTYEIQVANFGDFPATETVLTMELPMGLGFVSSSLQPASVAATETGLGQTVTWNIGTLNIDQVSMLSVTAQSAHAGLQISSLRLASAEDLSSETMVSTAVVPGTLEVRKSGPDEVDLGGLATYTVQVLSSGTGANTQIRLIDTIPDGMSFVSASQDPVSSDDSHVTFDIGTLEQGNAETVQIVLRADQPGPQENKVTVTSAEGGSADDATTTQVVRPILSASKTGPESVLIGTPFDYTLTIANTGDGSAYNATLTDTLPDGLQYVSAEPAAHVDGQMVQWNLGELQPGASRTVSLTVVGVQGGMQANMGVASADGDATAVTEATAMTHIQAPAIDLEITGRSVLFIGNQAAYQLTATNTGDAHLTGATITESIPAGMSYVTSDPMASISSDGAQLTWQIGDIAVGGQATATVVMQAEVVGMISKTAGVSTTEGASATAAFEVRVVPAAGATIAITDNVDPVLEGESIEFTVTVNNQGRSAITGVQINVEVDSGLTVTGISDERATLSEDGMTVTLALSEELAVDDSITFVVTTMANELSDGMDRHEAVTTATLTHDEFQTPVSAQEGTTVIEP